MMGSKNTHECLHLKQCSLECKVEMSRGWFVESNTKLQLSLIDQLEFNACSLQKVHKLVVMMLTCELLLKLLMFLLSETSERCPWNVSKPTKHIEYECPSRNFGWEWDILVRGHSNLAWMMKEIHQNDMIANMTMRTMNNDRDGNMGWWG
jgi:hypothetical protein